MGEKSRGNWPTGICLRARHCVNAEKGCDECVAFSKYVDRFYEGGGKDVAVVD